MLRTHRPATAFFAGNLDAVGVKGSCASAAACDADTGADRLQIPVGSACLGPGRPRGELFPWGVFIRGKRGCSHRQTPRTTPKQSQNKQKQYQNKAKQYQNGAEGWGAILDSFQLIFVLFCLVLVLVLIILGLFLGFAGGLLDSLAMLACGAGTSWR